MATANALPETPLVLDTDVFTQWRTQNPRIKQAIDEYFSRFKRPPELTSTTVFEALRGIEKVEARKGVDARTQQYRFETERLIKDCVVLPFNEPAAVIAAYIYARLSKGKQNKHWEDILIAATALAHGYGVATGNKRDFDLIAQHLPPSHPLLRLAGWKP
jgi:predicted nucleic acid-binding protein